MGLDSKNVLVTGGTGFIGSHLVECLIEKKANVIVPFLSINHKNYFFSKKLDKNTILVHCDIKNLRRITDIITKYEIDYIFHLAAQPIVTTAYYNPIETIKNNIMGTANVLEAARTYGIVKGIIVVSSDKAYGKIPKADESKPLSGDHPYEISKVAADFIASAYFKTYNLPIIVTRFGNVYGEGDINFSRIIPGIFKSIIKNEKLLIRSNGKYVRDYIYVKDVIEAMLLLCSNLSRNKGEAFNISSSENTSVVELIKKIEKILSVKIEYKILASAVNEIPVQSINYGKIRLKLDWKPKDNLATTIVNIHEWYKKYFEYNN